MTDAAPTPTHAPIVDAHLDLAHNAVASGRDLRLPLDALRQRERRTSETAMVTWPELRDAGIDLVFGTLYASPAARVPMQAAGPAEAPASAAQRTDRAAGYVDAEGAHAQALAQLRWYESMASEGWIRIVRNRSDLGALQRERSASPSGPIGVVLLMEGADPVRTPDEVQWWWQQGVRIIGPAWQGTRYAGGTRAPGPLTALGRDLVDAMSSIGMALDVSHLADESLWQALERHRGAVLASHSNARSLTPTDRHLSDDALVALGERDAVVGLVLGNAFLDASVGRGGDVDVARVGEHFEHVRGLVGDGRVGIGSDLDGGFGAEETPVELSRGRDFVRLAEAVAAEQRASFLGAAWWSWLERSLPET
ncbi:MAG: peptidase M19 [Trueperaceae bacterium]|nr:MAG: peptidase M19 [Trueperaceae bacterium]